MYRQNDRVFSAVPTNRSSVDGVARQRPSEIQSGVRVEGEEFFVRVGNGELDSSECSSTVNDKRQQACMRNMQADIPGS